jgi:hypothetical protein
MKTSSNHASGHQLLLKARYRLSDRQFAEMLELLEELTHDERAVLADSDFITEDEADVIFAMRAKDEPTFPAEDVLAEFGHSLKRRA